MLKQMRGGALAAVMSLFVISVGAFSLEGCAGQSANQAIMVAAQDAGVIATGLKGALANLQNLNIPGLTADKQRAISVALTDIQTVATSLSSASTTAQAQPLVQQIETDLNAVVDSLAGLPLPPQISMPIQAAAVLLPVIETAIGMAVAAVHPATPATSAAVSMTPDEARLILKGAAAH